MILKYNNGRGAVLCDQCRVIIYSDFFDFELKAFSNLEIKNQEFFCKTCCYECFKNQWSIFLKEVDNISEEFSKNHREYLVKKYNVYT